VWDRGHWGLFVCFCCGWSFRGDDSWANAYLMEISLSVILKGFHPNQRKPLCVFPSFRFCISWEQFFIITNSICVSICGQQLHVPQRPANPERRKPDEKGKNVRVSFCPLIQQWCTKEAFAFAYLSKYS